MATSHPFPYRRRTVLVDIVTGDDVVTLADELDGIVAAKTPRAECVMFRHNELAPRQPRYSKDSYDCTSVAEVASQAQPPADAPGREEPAR